MTEHLVITLPLQAETDRMLFEDSDPATGFMLHPDLKWVSGTFICVLFQFVLLSGASSTQIWVCVLDKTTAKGHSCKLYSWNLAVQPSE